MDDLANFPLNTPIEYGGRLCMVVKSGDDLELLEWVSTGPNSGFWLA
jgi:hypothetical protein